MTFIRTASGLRNYAEFFGCDLIVYTEGKNGCENTFDEHYYSALIKELTKLESIKIKVVGNKDNAMSYFRRISESNENNSIVIIDKDLIGITSSLIEHKNLFTTYGYSWENDFWTLDMCHSVIDNLTINNKDLEKIKKSLSITYRYAGKICALDVVCQVNGETIIPKKKNSCGIKLSLKKYNFIETHEFKRHMENYREKNFCCQISKDILKISMQQIPCQIVQGHLWEHIALTIISTYYKK